MTDQTAAAKEPQPQPLEMSDEDFAKLNGPPEAAAATAAEGATDPEPKPETEAKPGEVQAGEGEDNAAAAAAEAPAEADAGGEAAAEAEAGAEEAETKAEDGKSDAKPADKTDATGSDPEKSGDKVEKTTDKAEAESKPVDYEAEYKRLLAPLKANGKVIELRSPDELIQLAQMGANYTRKLQELQPHRKIVTMLANNDLLDEGKLSFLIDLDKKDPGAIRKLVKDSGIDILDIDPDAEPAYEPGSHSVSDQEVSFRSATDELLALPGGRETISEVHSRWDQASKEALWDKPEILATIHEHRSNGAYATITAEMDRQITLGKIPPNTPFLEAYIRVGDALVEATKHAAGREGEQPGQKPEMSGSAPQPVASRAAAPKSPLANDDKAKAASPTRATPKKAEVVQNPLKMSDADFLKNWENRV